MRERFKTAKFATWPRVIEPAVKTETNGLFCLVLVVVQDLFQEMIKLLQRHFQFLLSSMITFCGLPSVVITANHLISAR